MPLFPRLRHRLLTLCPPALGTAGRPLPAACLLQLLARLVCCNDLLLCSTSCCSVQLLVPQLGVRLHDDQAEEAGLVQLLEDMVLCWSPQPDKWVYSVQSGCVSSPELREERQGEREM